MNKTKEMLEIIEGFQNLTSKIKDDHDCIKKTLKNREMTIAACKTEYQKLHGEYVELKKKYTELIKKNEEKEKEKDNINDDDYNEGKNKKRKKVACEKIKKKKENNIRL